VVATDKERYFVYPVDERGAPNYYSIIKTPMCFSMMQQKLDARAYTSWRSFVADFEQIVTNARTYNTNKTRCYKCAQALQRNINKILGQHELDIRKAFTALFPVTPRAGTGAEAGQQQQQQQQVDGVVGLAQQQQHAQHTISPGPPSLGDTRPAPPVQHEASLRSTTLPSPPVACCQQEPPSKQPVTLRTNCGLQLVVPTLGSPPPVPPTARAGQGLQLQQQVLMPPPPRRMPICDHISDEEEELPSIAQLQQQQQQQQQQQKQQQQQLLPFEPPLLPFEQLLSQLRVSALRQPWPADQAGSGLASSGPSSKAAAQQQQSTPRHHPLMSSAERESQRPLEWQCNWLELRRRELLAQQHRLEALLQQHQEQGGASSSAGVDQQTTPSTSNPVATHPGAPAALAKQQAQLTTSMQRFLGHAVLPPPPAQPTIALAPGQPSQQEHAVPCTGAQQQQQHQQQMVGSGDAEQPPLLHGNLFYQLRAERVQLGEPQEQQGDDSQAASPRNEPMAIDQQQPQQQLHEPDAHAADGAVHLQPSLPGSSCTAAMVKRRGWPLRKQRQRQQQEQQQQHVQPEVQGGVPEALLPGALFSGFEVLQQQVQNVKQSLQAAFSLDRGGFSTGAGSRAGYRAAGALRRPSSRSSGRAGGGGGGLTVVTRPGTGGFESVKRKRSEGDLEGSMRMERSMTAIYIPPVRELSEEELAARDAANTTWACAYRQYGESAFTSPPAAIAAVLGPSHRKSEAEQDDGGSSSSEDTSDEVYVAMHAYMEEEERKRFAALAEGQRRRNKGQTTPNVPAGASSRTPRSTSLRTAQQQQQQQQQPIPSGTGNDGAAEQQAVASTSGRDAGDVPKVRFADIGCGFGGLLIRLSPLYPDTLMVGMELRLKVSEYVRERIASLRLEHPGQYGNVSCVRTNAMKYLPNYFEKGQLTKMFFLFPDPHFKAANHRRRIINTTLVTEYAYLMAPGGWLYTITDVEDLGNWMRDRLDSHPMFEGVSEEELEKDPAAGLLYEATEEGQKVARNKGNTYRAVYRRLAAPRELAANPERLVSRK